MWYSRDVRHEDLAGRKCAKCCVLPYFCGFAGSKSQVLRTGGCGGSVAQEVTKFAPRLRARTIWKSKSLKMLKTCRFGALLEVEVAKICPTPAREKDLEVKIVKNWHPRSTFGSWSRQNLHHALGGHLAPKKVAKGRMALWPGKNHLAVETKCTCIQDHLGRENQFIHETPVPMKTMWPWKAWFGRENPFGRENGYFWPSPVGMKKYVHNICMYIKLKYIFLHIWQQNMHTLGYKNLYPRQWLNVDFAHGVELKVFLYCCVLVFDSLPVLDCTATVLVAKNKNWNPTLRQLFSRHQFCEPVLCCNFFPVVISLFFSCRWQPAASWKQSRNRTIDPLHVNVFPKTIGQNLKVKVWNFHWGSRETPMDQQWNQQWQGQVWHAAVDWQTKEALYMLDVQRYHIF